MCSSELEKLQYQPVKASSRARWPRGVAAGVRQGQVVAVATRLKKMGWVWAAHSPKFELV